MEKIKWMRVMCFKHDGSLHRIWDKAALIYEDDEKIVISNAKTLIRESDNRIWMAKEPALSIFYKDRWFNIMGIIRGEGVHYYCNMATPSVVDEGVIKYIDYDLDLVKTVKGEIKILDEEEFKVNKAKYGYGKDIENILLKELEQLKEMAINGDGDFKDQYIYDGFNCFMEMFMRKEYEN